MNNSSFLLKISFQTQICRISACLLPIGFRWLPGYTASPGQLQWVTADGTPNVL